MDFVVNFVKQMSCFIRLFLFDFIFNGIWTACDQLVPNFAPAVYDRFDKLCMRVSDFEKYLSFLSLQYTLLPSQNLYDAVDTNCGWIFLS